MVLASAVLGARVGFSPSQVLPTSHSDARALARALVPDPVDAPPTGEFDYPFWYGGQYQARQSFVGGGRDREHLVKVMLEQLDLQGWRVGGVNPRPGATLVTAVQDDLEVVVRASDLPGTDPVEGLMTVMSSTSAGVGVRAERRGLGHSGGPSSDSSWPIEDS